MSESAAELADAVLADDLDRAAEALGQPVDPEQLKRDATRVSLHSCPCCDQTFASVSGYRIEFDGENTFTTTEAYFKLVRISPEMKALPRKPPHSAITEGEPDDHLGTDELAARERGDMEFQFRGPQR